MTRRKYSKKSERSFPIRLVIGIGLVLLIIGGGLVSMPFIRTATGQWAACEALTAFPVDPPSAITLRDDLAFDDPLRQMRLSGSEYNNLTPSPDGTLVVFGFENAFQVWDVSTAQFIFEGLLKNGRAEGFAWSPGSDYVAVFSVVAQSTTWVRRSEASVWHISSGEEQFAARLPRLRASPDQPLHQLAFTPDGSALYAATGNKLFVWNSSRGNRLCLLHRASLRAPYYQLMAINQFDSESHLLFRRPADALVMLNMTTTNPIWNQTLPPSYDVFWSPDGSLIALAAPSDSTQSSIMLLDARTGQTLYILDGRAPLAFSPDGEWMAAAADDGLLVIRETRSGEIVVTFGEPGPPPELLRWSPDGTILTVIWPNGLVRAWPLTP